MLTEKQKREAGEGIKEVKSISHVMKSMEKKGKSIKIWSSCMLAKVMRKWEAGV